MQNSYFKVLIKLYMFCLRWDTSTDAKDLQLWSLKSVKRQHPLVCIKNSYSKPSCSNLVVILNTGMEKRSGKRNYFRNNKHNFTREILKTETQLTELHTAQMVRTISNVYSAKPRRFLSGPCLLFVYF